MEVVIIMRARRFLEDGMIMVYQVISTEYNANGQHLLHTYTKKPHSVTKDRPKAVQPFPVDALCINAYILFV